MGLCNERLCDKGFPSFFKEGTDYMRSIKSGVVKSRFSFFQHSGDVFKNHLYWKSRGLTAANNTSMFFTQRRKVKPTQRTQRKIFEIMQIKTLITSLREALCGFA